MYFRKNPTARTGFSKASSRFESLALPDPSLGRVSDWE